MTDNNPWLVRFNDAPMPYQNWRPFTDDAVVEVVNEFGDSRIGIAKDFWWGYEKNNPEGVIVRCRLVSKEEVNKEKESKMTETKKYKIQYIFGSKCYALCYVSSHVKDNIIEVFPNVQAIFETYEEARNVKNSMSHPNNYAIVETYKARAVEDN